MAECSEYNAEFMIRLFQGIRQIKIFSPNFLPSVCYTVVGPSASMGIVGSRTQIPKSPDAQIPLV